MKTTIKKIEGNEVTMELKFKLEGSLLSMEEAIERCINAAGVKATRLAIEKFDTDGSPLCSSPIKDWTKFLN